MTGQLYPKEESDLIQFIITAVNETGNAKNVINRLNNLSHHLQKIMETDETEQYWPIIEFIQTSICCNKCVCIIKLAQ